MAYGVSRKALAARIGVHLNTLAAWEHGRVAMTVLRQRRYVTALREIVRDER